MILQHIVNLTEICAQKGIKDVILSVGSRNAPMVLNFVRHPQIRTRTISDERTAAFIALGIAQKTKRPVAIVCSSGSAAYNYAPAVAEAYFQQIPLLILTADRPPEWIDQQDNQTIRQFEIYGKNIKSSYYLPVSPSTVDELWHSDRIVSEALNVSTSFPAGPVHINVPLREPFYPEKGEEIVFDTSVKVIDQIPTIPTLNSNVLNKLIQEWNQFDKKLIIAGQGPLQPQLIDHLKKLGEEQMIPIVGDVTSNLHDIPEVIRYPDIFLGKDDEKLLTALQPDLLITFGKAVLSKNSKLFLRKYKPKAHWHIQPGGHVADTYQSLGKHIPVNPDWFFEKILNYEEKSSISNNTNYFDDWQKAEKFSKNILEAPLLNENYCEFGIIKKAIDKLPEKTDLQLANSMAVRYVNFVGINSAKKNIEVFSNRGTSGIDGCNSTAVGNALSTDKLTVLFTGDMAFLYDRNAFWHNYLPNNLRIILLNNHSGSIFRIIKGPSDQPELEEYFETRQQSNAQHIAKEFQFDYFYCNGLDQLDDLLNQFYSREGNAKILEIETDSKVNKEIFLKFKQLINEQ
ncbi:2-succinyl-5-enolpyruvyl-6-hydroxy-3-cyclohexene-1-carboxylic-acid synthase [Xanthovirga aplysinae]|uniref:2-succinyl-5-enolpyruvyl-6-hydroxy-3- cyclohexene-1-carboxylic-acid synthase n=1 Tax=Xanthovirga aplysinae TaxID=2529853 RepID=UPI0012BC73AB|nr:2-succinyl-5-enolpyruvyl-6-hydroxy-3-cyclohexene-1-carboxylic-acid synthase [Xanthovirga aplysinae]MTI33210.1 2-succinyl-5-enolpyruvyl-6-hydroxy-3-cyclohexene-1-carboxylic-acid synthase [Xanthovirga aplysinae]